MRTISTMFLKYYFHNQLRWYDTSSHRFHYHPWSYDISYHPSTTCRSIMLCVNVFVNLYHRLLNKYLILANLLLRPLSMEKTMAIKEIIELKPVFLDLRISRNCSLAYSDSAPFEIFLPLVTSPLFTSLVCFSTARVSGTKMILCNS